MEQAGSGKHRALANLNKYDVYLAILLVLFVCVHIVRNSLLPVNVDEANWLMQTRHLSAGYFLHPPFIVFQQFAVTRLLGDSPFVLRLGSLVFNTLSLVLIYLFSSEMFTDRRWAFFTVLVVSVLPMLNYWTMNGIQDAPLIFFFLLASFFTWRALTRESTRYWYMAGTAAGLMLLCNLRSTFFFPGILVLLLTTRDFRYWLRRKEPYLALVIVALIFTPTFVWYALRHFEPITYQITNRPGFVRLGITGYLTAVLKHIAWEGIGLSPFVYLLSLFGLVFSGYQGLVRGNHRFRFLFWISAPMVIFFFLTGGPPYWAFPGHVILLIAAVAGLHQVITRTSREYVKRYWLPAFVICFLVTGVVISLAVNIFMGTGSVYAGWRELAARVDQARLSAGENRPLYIASPYYFIASEIAYYEKDKVAGYTEAFNVYENAIYDGGSDYSPWIPLKKLVGKDLIFVDEKANPDGYETPVGYWMKKLKPYFAEVENPIIFTEKAGNRTFYIFKCHDFKGGNAAMNSRGDVRRYLRETKRAGHEQSMRWRLTDSSAFLRASLPADAITGGQLDDRRKGRVDLVSCQPYNVVSNMVYYLHNQPGRIDYEEVYRDAYLRRAGIS